MRTMRKTEVSRAFWGLVVFGGIASQALAGCGSSNEKKDPPPSVEAGAPNETGGTTNNEGGAPSDGGTAGRTGSQGGATSDGGTAGRPMTTDPGGLGGSTFTLGGTWNSAGGAPSGGISSKGGSVGAGGTPGCLSGVPCECKDAVGVTVCTTGKEVCSCPKPEECALPEDGECFKPCGGEPFGSWVLEDTCFPTTSTSSDSCQRTTSATAGDQNNLRLQIRDGGTLLAYGTEDWHVTSVGSLGCYNAKSVNECTSKYESRFELLFSFSGLASSCDPSACGVCDCEGRIGSEVAFSEINWTRSTQNKTLTLNWNTVDYCVEGDQLWLGGRTPDKSARAAYRFKKQSCTGTPTPCEQRSTKDCTTGDDQCHVGKCSGAPRCLEATYEDACVVLAGCTWDPEGCAGKVESTCNFYTCDSVPGCSWGEPVERCGGDPEPCENRSLERCNVPGCAKSNCYPNGLDYADCESLDAAQCSRAVGCTASTGTFACVGATTCTRQTNPGVCQALGCQPSTESYCLGTPTTVCSQVALAECREMGCQLEY